MRNITAYAYHDGAIGFITTGEALPHDTLYLCQGSAIDVNAAIDALSQWAHDGRTRLVPGLENKHGEEAEHRVELFSIALRRYLKTYQDPRKAPSNPLEAGKWYAGQLQRTLTVTPYAANDLPDFWTGFIATVYVYRCDAIGADDTRKILAAVASLDPADDTPEGHAYEQT